MHPTVFAIEVENARVARKARAIDTAREIFVKLMASKSNPRNADRRVFEIDEEIIVSAAACLIAAEHFERIANMDSKRWDPITRYEDAGE